MGRLSPRTSLYNKDHFIPQLLLHVYTYIYILGLPAAIFPHPFQQCSYEINVFSTKKNNSISFFFLGPPGVAPHAPNQMQRVVQRRPDDDDFSPADAAVLCCSIGRRRRLITTHDEKGKGPTSPGRPVHSPGAP